MTNVKRGSSNTTTMAVIEPTKSHRPKLADFLHFDTTSLYDDDDNDDDDNDSGLSPRCRGGDSTTTSSTTTSPYLMSPWNTACSPFVKSPWLLSSPAIVNNQDDNIINFPQNSLIKSLIREEGHIYSLAVSGDLLYTGSDSKNIRVWKNLKNFTGFKSSSGLVKAIIISGAQIFTGHQDGKIRVWKNSRKSPTHHKRIGSLPTMKDCLKKSTNPKNYVKVRRNKNALKIKHYDAVSSLSLDEEEGLLYSASWDKTMKVWRISDFKCVESVIAHEDAVNAVVVGFECFAFTGSADGTVKMWRREITRNNNMNKIKTKHVLDRVLLSQENAVTALAVDSSFSSSSTVIYCGSSDGLVNLWHRDPKSKLRHGGVLKGHNLAVLCIAVGGSLVFSGSADKNVCVWRREGNGAHTCLSVLAGHTGPVKCIAVDDGDEAGGDDVGVNSGNQRQRWTVYTGSLDRSVKVWRVWSHAPEEVKKVRATAVGGGRVVVNGGNRSKVRGCV